jgi:ribosomal 30S subunit maturation factor RimM
MGGWIGSMAELNVPKDLARQYAKQISEGNQIVMVLAEHGNRESVAERALADAGAVHVESYPYEARPDEFPGAEKVVPAHHKPKETVQQTHDHMRTGMDVIGSNGARVGEVKEIHDTDFLVDRERNTDIFVPFSAVQDIIVSNQTVVLSIPDYEVPHLKQRTRPAKPAGSPDWEIPSLS